jgi:hypothetical protein
MSGTSINDPEGPSGGSEDNLTPAEKLEGANGCTDVHETVSQPSLKMMDDGLPPVERSFAKYLIMPQRRPGLLRWLRGLFGH